MINEQELKEAERLLSDIEWNTCEKYLDSQEIHKAFKTALSLIRAVLDAKMQERRPADGGGDYEDY